MYILLYTEYAIAMDNQGQVLRDKDQSDAHKHSAILCKLTRDRVSTWKTRMKCASYRRLP